MCVNFTSCLPSLTLHSHFLVTHLGETLTNYLRRLNVSISRTFSALRVESCHISGREPNFACWDKCISHLFTYEQLNLQQHLKRIFIFIFLMNHLSMIDEAIGIAFVAAPWLEVAKLPTIPDPGTQFGFFLLHRQVLLQKNVWKKEFMQRLYKMI